MDEIKIKELEKQVESLKSELWKVKRMSSGTISYILLFLSGIMLAIAVVLSNYISSLIGVALLFWGTILLYIRPTQYIKKEILGASSVEPIKQMFELTSRFGFNGRPFYISQRTSKGVHDVDLVVPKNQSIEFMNEADLSSDSTSNSNFLLIAPPGKGLFELIERELKTNISSKDLDYIANKLEKVLVDGLEIAESVSIDFMENFVGVEIKGTIFCKINEDLSTRENGHPLEDPLTSALACIFALVTQKTVSIEKMENDPRTKTIKVVYKLK